MSVCSAQGCSCDNYLEELVNAAHLVSNGNCINCGHAVNQHARQPTSLWCRQKAARPGMNFFKAQDLFVLFFIFYSYFTEEKYPLCWIVPLAVVLGPLSLLLLPTMPFLTSSRLEERKVEGEALTCGTIYPSSIFSEAVSSTSLLEQSDSPRTVSAVADSNGLCRRKPFVSSL